jgi:hypothetical protein
VRGEKKRVQIFYEGLSSWKRLVFIRLLHSEKKGKEKKGWVYENELPFKETVEEKQDKPFVPSPTRECSRFRYSFDWYPCLCVRPFSFSFS